MTAGVAVPVAPSRRDGQGMRRRRALLAVGHHALLVALAAAFLLPIVFVVLTAAMTDHQVLSRELWPHPFRWANFRDVFRLVPLWRYAWNTTQIAVLSGVGVLVSCVPVAYALSRMEWRGRRAVLFVVLATYMLPAQATVVPLYVLFAKLHWVGSFKPLIVPSFFANAFDVFLLRQFFLTIPSELTDAARVEGASEWQVLTRVVLPLARPAIAAVLLFHVVFVWNDLFGPLLYIGENRRLWTLTLGLSEFRGLHHVDWNMTMAASVLFMVPIIVLFLFAQRAIVDAIRVTGARR